jgi:hypothetical protein
MRRIARVTSRSLATMLFMASSGASANVAQAQEGVGHAARAAPTSSDKPAAEPAHSSIRAGLLAGVGFPRPLAVEGLLTLGERVVLGAEYGGMPAMTVDGGPTSVGSFPLPIQGQSVSPVTMNDVRVSLWSVAAEGRWFPFGGTFFVGLRAGRQHVGATTTLLAPRYASMSETIDLDGWFLNPRVGLLWGSHGGIAFGVEAGVQVPIGATVASSIPLSLLPAVQRTAGQIGGSVIPTVDLLRLGFVL